jgi:hypothetical protein
VKSWVWFVAALALVGCRGKVPAEAPKTVLIAAQTEDEVRAAIVRTLAGVHFKYYTAEKDDPGLIVVRWQKGERFFRVSIEYSPKRYTIKYVDSHDFDAAPDPETGTLMISGAYGKLTRRLAEAIENELGRPARERGQAVAAERQHQINVENQRTRQSEAAREAERLKHLPPPAPQPVNVAPRPQPQPAPIQHQHKVIKGNQKITCCVNGAYYDCPSQQAFQSCMSMSPSQCKRKPGRDGSCR